MFSKPKLTAKQMKCMVDNAFHEAYAEGKLGRQIVMKVVLNRAVGSEDICEKVYAPKQFSWTSFKKKKFSEKIGRELAAEVEEVYYGFAKIPEEFLNATHFHVLKVKPVWRKSFKKLGVWKNHIFYKGV